MLRVEDRTGVGSFDEGRDAEDDDFGDSGRRGHGAVGRRGFRKGQIVRHPTFGVGRIAELSGAGQHTRAVVEFNTAGRKNLILEYARLEPVG